MNSDAVIGVFPMQPTGKDLQSFNLCFTDNDTSAKLGEEIVGQKITGNQQFLKVSIFSPDRFIRDFLSGILTFQGYECVNVTDFQSFARDLSLHVAQVVFLDAEYLMGSESESVRGQVQTFVQGWGDVVVLASEKGNVALSALLNAGGWKMVRKPLDYRQIGQVMAQMR